MPVPDPVPGLVLHYAYLWHDEYQQGMQEGVKDRPCVIVSAVNREDGGTGVTVVPVTHTFPWTSGITVEIPLATKRRLGLDSDRSWVVVTEVNRFSWPGPDLRQVPGRGTGIYHYGMVPPVLFSQIKNGILVSARGQRLRTTLR